ncbi:hypothetical protein NM688_g488 [Phlebia brevispora]|uniref:Uncharacterized protein n=1 Tax=Phlebia brevispora TaxID=194682 RepID=A0ACC1TDZ0_9APHY|nr:hypothetical protein NM688_g488 [Phlebia brevispora]
MAAFDDKYAAQRGPQVWPGTHTTNTPGTIPSFKVYETNHRCATDRSQCPHDLTGSHWPTGNPVSHFSTSAPSPRATHRSSRNVRSCPSLFIPDDLIEASPDHAKTLADMPDEYLADIGPAVKQVARLTGAEQYNVLQNNGKMAFQHVDHVHFHVIPKPSPKEGLVITIDDNWPQRQASKEELAATQAKMKARM